MSNPALASSRKRIERLESNIRSYSLPKESTPSEGDQPKYVKFISYVFDTLITLTYCLKQLHSLPVTAAVETQLDQLCAGKISP